MIDNTIIVEIDMPNEIDVDLGDAKFITAPEKQVPQAVPQIDVDNNGLITATSVQEAGSVRAGTTKSIYQLAVEQGKTISPSGGSQVAIEKGRFAVGDIVVLPLKVQEKELNVTDGGNYEVVPDNDYLLSRVGINVDISAKVDEAFQLGVKNEYDRFWDEFQENGTRTNYIGAFKFGWNEETLKPKYDLVPTLTGAAQMFQTSPIIDLKGHLESIGRKLDTSQCTSILQMFQSSYIKYIPIIDASNCNNNTGYTFSTDSPISIEKLIVSEKTIYSNNMFDDKNLESVIFEGTIANNGLNLSKCPKVNHESLMSIINALKSGVSGLTCTLGTTNLDKLTDAEKAIATEKGWSLA